MADTNYISSIVKVLENPIQIVLNNNIHVTKFRVQLPQLRNNRLIHLVVWGNLGQDVLNYYQINDYIIVEGYLSLRDKKVINLINKNQKKIEITVLKIYPFFLKSNSN